MESADYEATALSPQQQMVTVVLDRVCPTLDWHVSSGRVLHVGCSGGDVTAQLLLRRLPQDVLVVATDCSHCVVAQAAARFPAARLSFLPLHIGSRRIHNTRVWNLGPYSKVFSFFSLQWELRLRRSIKNISKLLCAGGETVLVMMSRSGLIETFVDLANSAKWSSFFKGCQQLLSSHQFSNNPQDDLTSYLEEARLTVKTCYQQEIMHVTKEELGFREMMVALNPFLSVIPEDMQGFFQRESEEAAFKNGLATARSSKGYTLYSIKYGALIAHALKTSTA